jgi:hypothetical protein
MKPKIEAVVRHVVWFDSSEDDLADTVRFIAYAMANATHKDTKVIRHYVVDASFIEALDKAPVPTRQLR